MKKIIVTLLFIGALQGQIAAQSGILVNTDWLKTRMQQKNLVIYHVGRESDYQAEHIDGAIFMDVDKFTYEDDTHVFDLPSDRALQDLFENTGLTSNDDVVIYTPSNWIPIMTRLYFTMNYIGHGDRTYILNGGLLEWKAKGEAVTTAIPEHKKSTFTIKPDKNLVADTRYVAEHLKDPNTSIVDCRAEVYYTGIDINEHHSGGRKGHIAGAKNIPYTKLYEKTSSGAFKIIDSEEMKELFEAQGVQKNKELILYCHIGMQLTVVYTAAKVLGFKNIRVYDGSFHEYGPSSHPVELD